MQELLPLLSAPEWLLISATHLEGHASTKARLGEIPVAAPPTCTHTAKLVEPHSPSLPALATLQLVPRGRAAMEPRLRRQQTANEPAASPRCQGSTSDLDFSPPETGKMKFGAAVEVSQGTQPSTGQELSGFKQQRDS